jgi:predicted transcriptional regulator
MTSQPSRHLAALARAASIVKRIEAGENKSAIARELGVTRQRVQAIARYGRLMRDIATKGAADA